MTLAYDRVGSGAPLVLLHGVGHRRQAWRPIVGLLRDRRELIMVDLPGHGESPPFEPNGREPVQAMAEDVVAFLDELGLERPHLAGNSLGGALGLIAGSWGRATTVTGLSPAGFWVNQRQFSYAKAIFKIMEATGRALQGPAPRLVRYRAGRALMFAAVVSRPSRLSPEQAAGDARAFTAARATVNVILTARGGSPRSSRIRSRSRSPGARRTGCCGRARPWWPSGSCRRPGSCPCPAAGTCR